MGGSVGALLLLFSGCEREAAPASLRAPLRVALEGRGPHALSVEVLDAAGNRLRQPPLDVLVEGPAHVDGDHLLCDGTGAAIVQLRLGELFASYFADCQFVAELGPREPAAELRVGTRVGGEEVFSVLDAFGKQIRDPALHLSLTSSDPSVLAVDGSLLTPQRAGHAAVKAVVGGQSASADVTVVPALCIEAELDDRPPDGAWHGRSGGSQIAVWVNGVEQSCGGVFCRVPVPAGPACGPYSVRVVSIPPAPVTGTFHDAPARLDLLLPPGAAEVPTERVLGEVVCGCDTVCTLPGATVAVLTCPPWSASE